MTNFTLERRRRYQLYRHLNLASRPLDYVNRVLCNRIVNPPLTPSRFSLSPQPQFHCTHPLISTLPLPLPSRYKFTYPPISLLSRYRTSLVIILDLHQYISISQLYIRASHFFLVITTSLVMNAMSSTSPQSPHIYLIITHPSVSLSLLQHNLSLW